MNRKLAVPLPLGRMWQHDGRTKARNRILRETDQDDLRMLMTLADNRVRLEKLKEDIETDPVFVDSEEAENELDYISASIRLGILEITGELEEIQSSDEAVDEVLA